MYTKSDFLTILRSNIDKYEGAAVLYRAGDPRAFAAMGAVAEMASMLSQQVELASMEVFSKARDTTVLADAALKGILPKAIPSIVNITVTNNNKNDTYSVTAGRSLLDSIGREYVALENTELEAGSLAIIRAEQKTYLVTNHTFEESEPLAEIEIPFPDSDKYISGIVVKGLDGSEYSYAEDYVNIDPNEKMFHVKVDEYRRLFVVFGYADVVGYQPAANESVVITTTETYGDISPKINSPFVLEYSSSPLDQRISMKMLSVDTAGRNPPDMATLRQMTNYPSIYDSNAVFLGEFDRLIRLNLSVNFLSVWNEQIEEKARGYNVDNINTLFVSIDSDGDSADERILELIEKADSSYKVKFVNTEETPYAITVNAKVARVYKLASVADQVRTLLLNKYGRAATSSEKGLNIPTSQNVIDTIRASIQALQDSSSDVSVSIIEPSIILPEQWHYLTSETLTISVTESNQTNNMYGR